MSFKPPVGLDVFFENWWNHIVGVEMPDEEEARLGWIFDTMMLISVVITLILIAIFLTAIWLDLFENPLQGVWAVLFPAALIPLSIFCFIQAKRGHVRAMIRLYIWVNFLGISCANFVFDGPSSSAWLLYFWPLSLANVLLPSHYVLLILFVLSVYYGLLYLVSALGIYQPMVTTSPALYRFLVITFGGTMALVTGGGVSYITRAIKDNMLKGYQKAMDTLEAKYRDLQVQLEERTTELQIRAEQFQAVAEVNRTASFILEVNQLLNSAVEQIARRFEYDHVGLFLIDESNQWAVLRSTSSEGGQRMLARGHRLRIGEQGIVGYVARTGVSRIALDVGDDAVWFNNPDLPDTRSEMALPLIARGRTIGVLDIQTNQPRAFTEDDILTLRVLADGIAVSIDNARLLEDTQRTLSRLNQLQEQNAIQAWRQALARRNIQLNLMYSTGTAVKISPEQITSIIATRPLQLETRITDEGMYQLVIPVTVRDQDVGLLAFEKARPWRDDELRLTGFVVEQLSLALENARLLEETRLRAAQEAARSDIVSHLRGLSTTDAILRSAARELGQALQVDRSRIQLLPPGERES
ncbi:MAG: GAF domain-containing protein [Anaerolineae bacterium]|nr:GAF domain-containing protein [Anaerolineae bacterium]